MSRKFFYLFELILSADIYGTRPQLKIGKLQYFKTRFGSILTILSIISMMVTVIYSSLQLFDDKNPKVMNSIINIFDPPEYKLSKDNYGFAFGLQDPITYDQFIDETVYRVEVYQKNAIREKNSTSFKWKVTQLDVEACNIKKFPKSYETIFISVPLNQMYCLKNTSFSLFGTFLNDQYSFIYLQLFECRNDSLKDNQKPCKPKSYIDKMLAGAFFSFSHTDITIDPTNYTFPDRKYAGDSYTTVSNRYFKEMHHYLKQINIITDSGWLISDISKSVYLKDDNIKEMIDFRSFDNFLSYTLKLSTLVETYTRSYYKIQNVAAEVGGFIKIISIICILLSYFYNRAKFYELLINELFECSPESGNSFKRRKEIKLQDLNNIKSNNKLINNFLDNNRSSKEKDENNCKNASVSNFGMIDNVGKKTASGMINLYAMKVQDKNALLNDESIKPHSIKNINIEEENKIINQSRLFEIVEKSKNKKLTLSLTFWESFWYLMVPCCFKMKRNLKIVEKAYPIIDERLDILSILKKVDDIDRLKALMFDTDQLKVFNLPYRTRLHIENGRKTMKNSNIKAENEIKNFPIEEVIKAFENIKLNKFENRMNENILNVLNEDYKQIYY